MPRLKTFQTNFTSGELDDFLLARVDTKQYFNGARRLRNVLLVPQGGAFRRFGLEFNDKLPYQLTQLDLTAGGITVTAPEGGTPANAIDDDLSTEILTGAVSTTDPFVIVHVDLGSAMTIQFADAVSLRYPAATTATPNEWRIQFSTDDIVWVNFGLVFDRTPLVTTVGTGTTQRSRAAVFGGTSAQFWRVVKIGGTDPGGATAAGLSEFRLFTMGTTISNCRDIGFQFSTTQRYMLVVTDRNIGVYIDGVRQVDIPIDHTHTQLPFLNWTQNLDTLFLFHHDVHTTSVMRQGSNVAWQPSLVNFTNIPQFDFGSGAEDMVSDARGWFVSGVIFQGRLSMAGARSRPSTFVASKSGLPFNLDVGTGLDDEAIVFTVTGDDVAEFFQINAGRHLQCFASNAEYYVPISDTGTITPGNFTLRRTTGRGSKGNVIEDNSRPRLIEVDGVPLFVQRGGKSLRDFLFTDTEAAYVAENVTLLSTELVVNPLSMALRKSTSTQEADYVLLPNTDGTLAVFVTLRAQDVNAMTLQSTKGLFKDAGVDLDDMYFCIKRTINSVDVLYLERFSSAVHMDAAISAAPVGAILSGLDHLEGEEIEIIVDDLVHTNRTVVGGQVTLTTSTGVLAEAGLAFPDGTPLIRLMPVEGNLPEGTIIGKKKRIVDATFKLKDTKHFVVKQTDGFDNVVLFRQFGSGLLDQPLPSFTGEKKVEGLLGYSDEGSLDITQDVPVDMTILGIAQRVAV